MSSEAKSLWYEVAAPETISGYELLGCSENMLANRISYFFDLHGPSTVVDTGAVGGREVRCWCRCREQGLLG